MHDQSTRELRTRFAEQIGATDRLVPPPPTSAASMVVKTVTESSYPAAAGKYFACQQLTLDGPEVEGGPAAFGTLDGIIYVAIVDGSDVPAVGTKLIVDAVDGRWVVRA